MLGVLQIHAGEDRNETVRHIRGIHSASHSHFDHRHVDLAFAEVFEGHGGGDLEEGGMIDRPCRGHRMNRRLHPRPEAEDIVVGDRGTIDLDPFVETHEMGRGVQAHAIPRLLQSGGGVSAYGALAVGPGDVQDPQAAMRVSEQRQEAPDALEAQLDPKPLETIEMVERRRVIHRSGGANGAGGLKVPRGRARGLFPHSNEAHSYISRMRNC